MKIGNSPEASAPPAKADKAGSGAPARKPEASTAPQPAPTAAAPAPSAQVAISATAAKLAASGSDDGSFDAAKVDRIAQAITEGKFTINARAIADKLVSNAQELLDNRADRH